MIPDRPTFLQLQFSYSFLLFYLCFNFKHSLLIKAKYPELQKSMRTLSGFDINEKDAVVWNEKANLKKHLESQHKLDISKVFKAGKYMSKNQIVKHTPFEEVDQLSELFGCRVFVKRQEQQLGKTFKIRGAYFQYCYDVERNVQSEYVTASDGNFASACTIIAALNKKKLHAFVPLSCFEHKSEFIKSKGGEYVEIHQVGADYEECVQLARQFAKERGIEFLHPFESYTLMAGYATVAKELLEQHKELTFDYIVVPTGGGALVSSIASYVMQTSPETKVVSVETDIATPFSDSIKSGQLRAASKASKFCNGSSVKETNEIIRQIAETAVSGFVHVSDGIIAQIIIKLYSIGIISEPSGALGFAALTKMKQCIKGKNVAVILTGANIDLTQLNEARDMNLISKGYKNCYIFELPNKKNIIYELITECFKETDIISVQFSKKTSKESSQALISVESLSQEDVEESIDKLRDAKYAFEIINEKEQLLDLFF